MSDTYSKLLLQIKKKITSREFEYILPIILREHEAEKILLRLRVLELLIIGTPYREITKETGASSKTIAQVATFLEQK